MKHNQINEFNIILMSVNTTGSTTFARFYFNAGVFMPTNSCAMFNCSM